MIRTSLLICTQLSPTMVKHMSSPSKVWNAVGAIIVSNGHLEPRDTQWRSIRQGMSYQVALVWKS